jgi:hypothetical protein
VGSKANVLACVTGFAFSGWLALTIWGFLPEAPPPKMPAVLPAALRSLKTKPVRHPPRPYLTPQVEEWIARDKCTITKQRCRNDGVCDTCMVCPYMGRRLLGSAFTKCATPVDCVLLETNVEWERENVDPGWCEAP